MKQKKNLTHVKNLQKALSNEFALYTKTLKFHWNVYGKHFVSWHELLEKQYERLQVHADQIAERIVQLGGQAMGTLQEFHDTTQIEERPGYIPKPLDMIASLLADHEKTLEHHLSLVSICESENDPATADLLTEQLRNHAEMAWTLRATITESRSN